MRMSFTRPWLLVLAALTLGLVTYAVLGVAKAAPQQAVRQFEEPRGMNWQHVWSLGSQHLARAKVPGGWLVLLETRGRQGITSGGGITFYPDPKHTWNGSTLP